MLMKLLTLLSVIEGFSNRKHEEFLFRFAISGLAEAFLLAESPSSFWITLYLELQKLFRKQKVTIRFQVDNP